MQYVDNEYKHYKVAKTANALAFASLISAILSTLIGPLVLSPLAIIFGVISKGKTKAYALPAKIAFFVATIALILDIFIGAFAVYNVFFNESYRQQVDEVWQQYYGMTFDEYTDAFYNELIAPLQ